MSESSTPSQPLKAIIAVAGYGTRRLPVTKAIEKCMLPVLNRPIIDYVVADCVAAGVGEIIFVVSPDGSDQLRTYFSHNRRLEKYLKAAGKREELALIKPPKPQFKFMEQPANVPYGTAIPVALARHLIPANQSALVVMGDDFLYRHDGGSDMADLVQLAGDDSALLAVEIDRQLVSGYGVLRLDEANNFQAIVEKPKPQHAPSNLINVSKYIMNSVLLDEVQAFCSGQQALGQEYQIIEPINRYVAKQGRLKVRIGKGLFCDGGNLPAWLDANNRLAKLTGLA